MKYTDPTGYLNDIQPETFDPDDDYNGRGGTGASTVGGEMGSYNYSGPYSLYVSNPTLYGYFYGTETWMEHATYVAYVRSSMRDAYTYANSGYSMVHKRGTDNIGSAGEKTYDRGHGIFLINTGTVNLIGECHLQAAVIWRIL